MGDQQPQHIVHIAYTDLAPEHIHKGKKHHKADTRYQIRVYHGQLRYVEHQSAKALL